MAKKITKKEEQPQKSEQDVVIKSANNETDIKSEETKEPDVQEEHVKKEDTEIIETELEKKVEEEVKPEPVDTKKEEDVKPVIKRTIYSSGVSDSWYN